MIASDGEAKWMAAINEVAGMPVLYDNLIRVVTRWNRLRLAEMIGAVCVVLAVTCLAIQVEEPDEARRRMRCSESAARLAP